MYLKQRQPEKARAALEEMICSLYRYQPFRRRHLFKPFHCEVIRGKFILSSMNKEFWLMAALQCVAIKCAGGYAKTYHSLDTVINSADTQSYV